MFKVIRSTLSRSVRASMSTYSGPKYELKHDAAARQYYIEFAEQQCRAFVSYRLGDAKQITLEHTEVPPQMNGKGVGKYLADTVLKKLSDDGYQVEIECSFLKKAAARKEKP